MPHVTVLYPFVPEEDLAEAARLLRGQCAQLLPFTVRLAGFGCFAHGRLWATVWLRPDPPGPICRLQECLLDCFPWCTDTARYASGFTPHLSVGRWPQHAVNRAQQDLQAGWTPFEWRVDSLHLIARPDARDSTFSVRHGLPLGVGEG
jgi:poly(A) polymerase